MNSPDPKVMAQEILKIRPLLEDLLKAEDRMQSTKCLFALTTFLEYGSDERIHVFCTESWQVGKSVFNAALKNGITAVTQFPENMRLSVTAIASLWTGEFKKHPKIASSGLVFAETKLWQKGDDASDWWAMWFRDVLKHSLGRDVQEIIRQNLS